MLIEELIPKVVVPLSFIALYLVIFVLAKSALKLLEKYSFNVQIADQKNTAVGVAFTGYLLAITIIFIGALAGPTQGWLNDILLVAQYSILGCVFLLISRIINDKLILSQFENYKELVDDKNAGTGAVVFGSYVASGLVVAGAIHGEGGGMLTATVFFILGQLALVLFTRLYNVITPYCIHDEIEKDNVAVGVAFGGTLVALGAILMNGASGGFYSWSYNLSKFAIMSVGAFVLLPAARIFMDKVLIPKYDLNHALAKDANLAAGLLEACMVVCLAAVVSVAI